MGGQGSKPKNIRRVYDGTNTEAYDTAFQEENAKHPKGLRVRINSVFPGAVEWDKPHCALSVFVEGSDDYEDPLLSYIYASVLGKDVVVHMPYGDRELIYCDYVSTGKSLRFIEEFISDNVLTFLGTADKTTASHISRQMTVYQDDARQYIRTAVQAADEDKLIFTGNTQVSACSSLARVLKQRRHGKATVVAGPYLPEAVTQAWESSGFMVINCKENNKGQVDLTDLEEKLQTARASGGHVMCHMSAVSSCTGRKVDLDAVAKIVHKEGATLFADFSTAGPYVQIDMNKDAMCYLDAVFIVVDKFVGGATCPGLLIVRDASFRLSYSKESVKSCVLPQEPCTLDQYLSRSLQRIQDIDASVLEKPQIWSVAAKKTGDDDCSIVHLIRAAAALHLKQAVGCDLIQRKHNEFLRQAVAVWGKNSNIILLGGHAAEDREIPVFSFLVRHPGTGQFLHQNFVTSLLSDLYGIQTRALTCNGSHIWNLLDDQGAGCESLRKFMCRDSSTPLLLPGFVRLNLPYFFNDSTVHYVIEAVDMIATHGWKFLPEYTIDRETGGFHHLGTTVNKLRQKLYKLTGLRYENRGMVFQHPPLPKMFPPFCRMSEEALGAVKKMPEEVKKIPTDVLVRAEQELLSRMSAQERQLVWFLLPSQALKLILQQEEEEEEEVVGRTRVPFLPRQISSQPKLNSLKRQSRGVYESLTYDHDLECDDDYYTM